MTRKKLSLGQEALAHVSALKRPGPISRENWLRVQNLLFHLASYLPDIRPGEATLAEKMGISDRQIRRYLRMAEKAGLLITDTNEGTKTRGRRTNRYHIVGLGTRTSKVSANPGTRTSKVSGSLPDTQGVRQRTPHLRGESKSPSGNGGEPSPIPSQSGGASSGTRTQAGKGTSPRECEVRTCSVRGTLGNELRRVYPPRVQPGQKRSQVLCVEHVEDFKAGRDPVNESRYTPRPRPS